jgi:hypothetical protein
MTPTNRMKIEGVHAVEYASQWGCGTPDGVLFYNCSDYDPRGRGVIPNPEWTREDWRRFRDVVTRQAQTVEIAIKGKGRSKSGWTKADADNLRKLAKWVEYYGETLDTRSNWR